MAGSSTAESASQPAFYFDLGSPEAYLAAERVLQVLPTTAEWIPVLARDLPGAESWEAFRCCDEQEIAIGRIETLAAGQVLAFEPMLSVDGIGLYLEDMILITKDGYENLSAFVPVEIADIEKTMAERGLHAARQ